MAQDSIHILLAAEDPQLRETLKLLLNEQLGIWDITTAASGDEALAEIKKSSGQAAGMSALLGGMTAPTAKKCRFDLVLMDWNLDGDEFIPLKEIRKHHDRKALPVLLITKQRDKEMIQAALVAGATNFLFTPISADLLNKKFQEVLGRKLDFKAQAAISVFQKQDGKEKGEERKKTDKKAQILTGGASYHAKRAITEEEAKFAVSLLLSPTEKVEGHFHQFVDVVGGGRNCYWAREILSGEGAVAIELEYLTPKGKSSGHHANTISKEEFMASFYVCTTGNCALARAGAASTDPGQSSPAAPQESSLAGKHVHEVMEDGNRSSSCYLAKAAREEGKPVMGLSYLSSTERPLGHAKNVELDFFKDHFRECTPLSCPALKKKEELRIEEERAQQERHKEISISSREKSPPPVHPVEENTHPASTPVDGHYQGKLESGATNCFWAKERSAGGLIDLEYVTPKGTASGMAAKTVSREKFLKTFAPCTTDNCPIMKAMAASPKKPATEIAPSPSLAAPAPVQEAPESGATSILEGHYQETIDKSSNIKKCVWAKEVSRDGKKVVQAFLIGPKGRSSGIHDRYVTLDDFRHRYTLCTKENCDILRRQ